MIATELTGDLVVGLVLGFLLGLIAGPLIRSWLIWREWVISSRDADIVRHDPERPDDRRMAGARGIGDRGGPMTGSTRGRSKA